MAERKKCSVPGCPNYQAERNIGMCEAHRDADAPGTDGRALSILQNPVLQAKRIPRHRRQPAALEVPAFGKGK